jgi:hypothetical protein
MDMDQVLSFKFDSASLIASLWWSAVGAGFWAYGKKQRSGPPLFGGLALIAISWLIASALWMSLAAVGVLVGVFLWSRHD